MTKFVIKDTETGSFFVDISLHFTDIGEGVRFYSSTTCDLGPRDIAKEMNEAEARGTKTLLEGKFLRTWELVPA